MWTRCWTLATLSAPKTTGKSRSWAPQPHPCAPHSVPRDPASVFAVRNSMGLFPKTARESTQQAERAAGEGQDAGPGGSWALPFQGCLLVPGFTLGPSHRSRESAAHRISLQAKGAGSSQRKCSPQTAAAGTGCGPGSTPQLHQGAICAEGKTPGVCELRAKGHRLEVQCWKCAQSPFSEEPGRIVRWTPLGEGGCSETFFRVFLENTFDSEGSQTRGDPERTLLVSRRRTEGGGASQAGGWPCSAASCSGTAPAPRTESPRGVLSAWKNSGSRREGPGFTGLEQLPKAANKFRRRPGNFSSAGRGNSALSL